MNRFRYYEVLACLAFGFSVSQVIGNFMYPRAEMDKRISRLESSAAGAPTASTPSTGDAPAALGPVVPISPRKVRAELKHVGVWKFGEGEKP